MFHCFFPGDGMDAAHAQQQLIDAGVTVEGGGGVEMMVMDSLDPALLQMKTEVNDTHGVQCSHFFNVMFCIWIHTNPLFFLGFGSCCRCRSGWWCPSSHCDNSGPDPDHHPAGQSHVLGLHLCGLMTKFVEPIITFTVLKGFTCLLLMTPPNHSLCVLC